MLLPGIKSCIIARTNTNLITTNTSLFITPREPQTHFGDKPVNFQVICIQIGTAVLKGLIGIEESAGTLHWLCWRPKEGENRKNGVIKSRTHITISIHSPTTPKKQLPRPTITIIIHVTTKFKRFSNLSVHVKRNRTEHTKKLPKAANKHQQQAVERVKIYERHKTGRPRDCLHHRRVHAILVHE